MKMRSLVSLPLLCALVTGAAFAQRETLLIGPGDLLQVKVLDTPTLDETARVSDTGELPLLFGGTVKVMSLTPEQAAHAIEGALKKSNVMRDPLVLVTVSQYATEDVSVFGQVTKPGNYPLTTPRPVIDVLSMAGGFTDLARRQVIIQRHGTGEQDRITIPNDPTEPVGMRHLVNPGDEVIVPKVDLVYVLGDVGRPGGYPINDNQSQMTILEAIAMAGGIAPSATPNHSRLIRHSGTGYTQTSLPLSAMQKGKMPDAAVQANDIIYVPFSYARNVAVGMGGIVASTASAAIYMK